MKNQPIQTCQCALLVIVPGLLLLGACEHSQQGIVPDSISSRSFEVEEFIQQRAVSMNVRFEQTIDSIAKSFPPEESAEFLFASREFVDLLDHPLLNFGDAQRYLGDPAYPTQNKRIVALAMQKLPLENLLSLARSTADAVKAGRTGLAALRSLVFPPFDGVPKKLLIGSDRPEVVALFRYLVALDILPLSERKMIEEQILTGQAKASYIQYMEMQGRPVE